VINSRISGTNEKRLHFFQLMGREHASGYKRPPLLLLQQSCMSSQSIEKIKDKILLQFSHILSARKYCGRDVQNPL
jgi:hypothetical protein